MSYIGTKPVDFNDVTEAQTFGVTGDLTIAVTKLFTLEILTPLFVLLMPIRLL